MMELLGFWVDTFSAPDVRVLPYDPAGEATADAYFEALEADPFQEQSIGGAGARVILERAMQMTSIATMHHVTGDEMIRPAVNLSKAHRQIAAGLLALYRTKLPLVPAVAC
jgi:hypothetical protein